MELLIATPIWEAKRVHLYTYMKGGPTMTKIIAVSSTTTEMLTEYRQVYHQWACLKHEQFGYPVVQCDDNLLIQMALERGINRFKEDLKKG